MPPEQPNNPFAVRTPEHISAEDAASLFVDVFTDFPKVPHVGHTFIHGPRGSGKSMMFRYLQPDCQCLTHNCQLRELSFYGVFIPIKNSNLPTVEFQRLKDQHANVILNEHFMVIDFVGRIVSSIISLSLPDENGAKQLTATFVEKHFFRLLRDCGWEGTSRLDPAASFIECFRMMKDVCDSISREGSRYLKRLSTGVLPPYEGVICGYVDFLLPFVRELRLLSFMPQGPVFLMVDDADNLNRTQTMILNSWVAMRTIQDISLKISTQLRYQTYRTISGQAIEAPHDYSEVNIATVYTSSRSRYFERLREIIRKRLLLARIDVSPEDFFPPDIEQEKQIAKIADKYVTEWHADRGRGFRARDDALRYARPDFIADLQGTRKAGSSYSYAGFDQLAHVSSGLIRYFLDPAAQMFAQQASDHPKKVVQNITPTIQNAILRQEAEQLLFKGLEKLADEMGEEEGYYRKVTKLSNLIRCLGGTFHRILVTRGRSERRVFSIAFSDQPDEETLSVIKLGIRHGYFHVSSIGNKDGTGRTPLYVLTRRLAPSFLLDPFGFAGYLFVTTLFVRDAMSDLKVVRRIKDVGVDEYFASGQLSLFDER